MLDLLLEAMHRSDRLELQVGTVRADRLVYAKWRTPEGKEMVAHVRVDEVLFDDPSLHPTFVSDFANAVDRPRETN
jgi:hypothetical protein